MPELLEAVGSVFPGILDVDVEHREVRCAGCNADQRLRNLIPPGGNLARIIRGV